MRQKTWIVFFSHKFQVREFKSCCLLMRFRSQMLPSPKQFNIIE